MDNGLPTNNFQSANGFDLLSQLNPTQQPQPQPMQQPKPEEKGNWFTNLLPTIGSIAAPTIGALLAPETGGLSLLGGLAAGAALSGAGGAAGKVAENALEGNDIGAGVGEQAVSDTLLGGLGGVAGKAISGVTKAASPLLKKGAGEMIQTQFMQQLDKPTAEFLANHGVFTRQGATDLANRITGYNGLFPKIVNKGFQGSDRVVNIADLDPDLIKAAGADHVFNMDRAGLNPLSQKTALANIRSVLNKNVVSGEDITKYPSKGGQLLGYGNGVLNNMLPENTFSAAKDFEKLAAQEGNKAFNKFGETINADHANLYNYYKNLANELNSRAFGVDQEAIPLTPELKSELLSGFGDLQKSNPQAYKAISEAVNGAQNLQDLRSLQKPWVDVSKADNAATVIKNGKGGLSAAEMITQAGPTVGAAGGPKGAVTGMLTKALGSAPANAAGASILGKASMLADNPKAQKLLPILSRMGALGVGGLAEATPQGNAGAMGNANAMINNTQGNMMEQPQQSQDPYNNYVNSLMTLSILAPSMFGGEASSVLPGIMPTLQKNAALKAQLGGLENTFAGAGGGQTGVPGVLGQLASFLPGTSQYAYNQEADAAAAQLAETLHISPQAARQLLPNLLQNPEAAQSRLSVLGQLPAGLPG